MKRLTNFPILLLQIPFRVRVGIVVVAFLLCQIIMVLTGPISHNVSIAVIPVALAAWFFRYRGMLLCILLTMLTMQLVGTFIVGISLSLLLSGLRALMNLTILIAIGLMVAYLRSMVDVVEASRRKAVLAEQQLQVAYEQQRQLIEQKDLFLLNINHELRSPLTVLYGSLELLRQSWGDNPPFTDDLQRTCFNRAVDSCDTLMLMSNQTLSAIFVNHEVPEPHFEAVSVAQVIQELLDSGDPRIGRVCHIHLELEEQAVVWADREFLSQIFWNVLSNARLYSPPDTEVTISATSCELPSVAAGADRRLCIRVKDEGPGIPDEEMQHLFSPFVRLKRDVAQSLPGSGLGLYISKRLAEVMQGQIWVESSGKPGEGSCFCLALPTVVPVLHVS
jgi:signal transduction histidine kinase